MDRNFYIEYYDLERKHWWFRVREKIILDHVKLFFGNKLCSGNPITILNVGVASGRSSEALGALGVVTSIEYDSDCCEFTRSKTGLEIINGTILDLPFEDNKFDMVCSFDVVEHVENDVLAIAEMKRVCKNDGVVFITVPAFKILWSHHDIVNHHYRRYRMSEIDKLFNHPKDKVIARTYYNSLLFVPIFLVRIISHLLPNIFVRDSAGSDFTLLDQDSVVNKFSYFIFALERRLLKYVKFPFGVSIIYAIKK